jgi:hypothetical protein
MLGRDTAYRSGAAYVLERVSSTAFREVERLEPPDQSPRFGSSVATTGDAVIVGTPEEVSFDRGIARKAGVGSVRLYQRNTDMSWINVATIRAAAPRGPAFAASGSMLAVSGVDSGGSFTSVVALGEEQ